VRICIGGIGSGATMQHDDRRMRSCARRTEEIADDLGASVTACEVHGYGNLGRSCIGERQCNEEQADQASGHLASHWLRQSTCGGGMWTSECAARDLFEQLEIATG